MALAEPYPQTPVPPIDQLEPFEWRLDLPSEIHYVRTELLSNHSAFDQEQAGDSVLVLPGYGENRWAAMKGLEACTRLGVIGVAAIANLRQIPADQKYVDAFVYNFAPAVAQYMQTNELSGPRTRAIGHSMGGALLGLGLRDASELFGSVGFLEAICQNVAALTEKHPNVNVRRMLATWRLARVIGGYYTDVSMSDRLHAGSGIFKQVGGDLRHRSEHRFRTQMQGSVTLDAVPHVLDHAASGQTVAHVFGGRDPLVKGAETLMSYSSHAAGDPDREAALREILVEFTNQKHSHMGWPDGARHLAIVTDMLDLRS